MFTVGLVAIGNENIVLKQGLTYIQQSEGVWIGMINIEFKVTRQVYHSDNNFQLRQESLTYYVSTNEYEINRSMYFLN